MNRYRINGAALALIAVTSFRDARAEPDPAAAAPGFALTAFEAGYPARTLEYETADARRLARELFPAIADQVVRATVSEQVGLPGGGYHGVVFDFFLEPRIQRRTICEQPRMAIVMNYTPEKSKSRTLQLVVRNGAIADHVFDSVQRFGRYRSLPDTLTTTQELLDACRELTGDSAGWKKASDANDFAGQKWRHQALIGALETLPSAKIKCIGIDGKPCQQDRSGLLSYLRDTPPRYSVSQFVPGEGEVNIFDYNDNDLDRDVTMWLDQGRPRTISIRFRKPNRPVI